MESSKSRKSRHSGDNNTIANWPSTMGLIIVDASFRPLFSNHEAITILTYSARLAQDSFEILCQGIRGNLLGRQIALANRNLLNQVIQFKSGRRTYFCRAFALDRKSTNGTGAALLIMFDREMPRSLAVSYLSEQFRLTHREQETVALLLQGLGNKEMAAHMGISENTVKSFLRTVTTKMNVSGRSAILNKVLSVALSMASEPTEKAIRD